MIILDPFKARSFASFQWLQFIHSLLIKDTSLDAISRWVKIEMTPELAQDI